MTLALAQIFHLWNARRVEPFQRAGKTPVNFYAIGAVMLTVSLQIAAVHVPALARVLDLVRMNWIDWMIAAGLAVIPVAVHLAIDTVSTRRREDAENRASTSRVRAR